MAVQWEYCELIWRVAARYEATPPDVIFYRGARRVLSAQDQTVESVAQQLGDDGWELVSVISYMGLGAGAGPEVHYYFKRPSEARS